MKIKEIRSIVLTLDEGEISKLALLVERGISQIDDNPHGKRVKDFGEKLVNDLDELQ